VSFDLSLEVSAVQMLQQPAEELRTENSCGQTRIVSSLRSDLQSKWTKRRIPPGNWTHPY